MLALGKVKLATNLLLSPIAGYCDLAFRLAIRPLGGLGLACTDLINPRGVLRRTRRTMQLVHTESEDHPLCMQLYGDHPGEMADAARWCCDHGADVIDINMGCPVEKVVKRGGGAAMLHRPEAAIRLAEQVVEAVEVPVTAKMRLGWTADRIVAPRLAADLERAGVAAVIIHGRTVDDGFNRPVRVGEVARVVEAVEAVPVIGNGGILCPADAEAMIRATGCAGVMIGRAALADPWIFRDIHAWLTAGRRLEAPTPGQRLEFARCHFDNLLRIRGPRVACMVFRQRFSWYARKLKTPKWYLLRMRGAKSADELRDLLDNYPFE